MVEGSDFERKISSWTRSRTNFSTATRGYTSSQWPSGRLGAVVLTYKEREGKIDKSFD